MARDMSKTRLFFVSDVHGSERLYLKFTNAGRVYKADVLVIGGDITGKTVTPIFQKNGSWSAQYVGGWRTANNQGELESLEKDVRELVAIRTGRRRKTGRSCEQAATKWTKYSRR